MVLGIQLYGPVAKGSLEAEELLAGLKRIGYSLAEPCISLDGKSGAPTFWQPEQLESYFAILKRLGLEAISCHVSAVDYIESIPVMCDMADRYHIRQFVVGTGGVSEEEIQATASVYCRIADAIKEHGAELLLHNGKHDIAAKLHGRTAYEYLVDCCEGKLGMQFDTGWAARGGEDPMTIIDRNRSRIGSLHFKDFDMRIDSDVDTCIGDGTLDNKGFLKFGQEQGIPLLVDADTYDDVLADAAKSYNYLEALQ